MTFDPTISVGNILTLFTVGAGVFWFLASLRSDLQVVVTRVGHFETTLQDGITKIGDALLQIARQDERLRAVEAVAHKKGAAARRAPTKARRRTRNGS